MSNNTFLCKWASRVAYLFSSAAPGGFRVLLFYFIGKYLGAEALGVVANEYALVVSVTTLSAMGAGNQIVHLVASEPLQMGAASLRFKGALLSLVPYATAMAIVFTLSGHMLGLLVHASASGFLLWSASIYWYIRHFFLGTGDAYSLLSYELGVWGGTILVIAVLAQYDSLSPNTILSGVGIVYLVASFFVLIKLPWHQPAPKISIIRDSVSVGLSNMVSGGVSNLAPSIAFHMAGPSLAGLIGLIINGASVTLTLIRAYLYKILPSLSRALHNGDHKGLADKARSATRQVSRVVIGTSFVLQPFLLLLSHASLDEFSFRTIAFYSIVTVLFVVTPQFSVVDATVLTFAKWTKQLLIVNSLNALLVMIITGLAYLSVGANEDVFVAFMLGSALTYLIRNKVLSMLLERMINEIAEAV